MRWLLLLTVAALGSCAVGRELSRPPCGDFGDAGNSECVISRAGGRPAEYYRDHGEELIRVFAAKGVQIVPEIVIVEVASPEDGPGVLTIRDPLGGHFSRSNPVDSARFRALRDKLISMPSNGTYPADPPGVETICLHPVSGWIETVLDGKLKRANFDYCQIEAKYIDDILDFAASFDGACAH